MISSCDQSPGDAPHPEAVGQLPRSVEDRIAQAVFVQQGRAIGPLPVVIASETSPDPQIERPPRRLSLPEKLELAQQKEAKWRRLAKDPQLSPPTALWAHNLARSYRAARLLYEKALAHENRKHVPASSEHDAPQKSRPEGPVPVGNANETPRRSSALSNESATVLAALLLVFFCWLLWPVLLSGWILLAIAAAIAGTVRGTKGLYQWWHN